MHYKYIKLNNEPINIEYVPDEHDPAKDFEPSFWWWNRRYYLEDFIRTHNNPWLGEVYPEHIHGYEANNWRDPLYISIADGGETLDLFEEVATR